MSYRVLCSLQERIKVSTLSHLVITIEAEMRGGDIPQLRGADGNGTLPVVLSESIATSTIVYSEHDLQKKMSFCFITAGYQSHSIHMSSHFSLHWPMFIAGRHAIFEIFYIK